MVEYVQKNGIYKFRFTDSEVSGSQHDFYGIHKFRIMYPPEKRDIDEILTIIDQKSVNLEETFYGIRNQLDHYRQKKVRSELIEEIEEELTEFTAAFEALKKSIN